MLSSLSPKKQSFRVLLVRLQIKQMSKKEKFKLCRYNFIMEDIVVYSSVNSACYSDICYIKQKTLLVG